MAVDDEGDEFAIEVDGGASINNGQLYGSFKGYNLLELHIKLREVESDLESMVTLRVVSQ
jgi:predicted Zn-dependent protease